MKPTISNLPRDFFGQSECLVMETLLDGLSVTVTGIPGFGKTVFAKHILRLLKLQHPDFQYFTIDINFLPAFSDPDFQKAINQRLNNSSQDLHSFLETISKKQRIIISLEGISDTTDPKMLSFFHQLGTVNHANITFLTTAHASVLDNSFLERLSASALFGKVHIVPGLSEQSISIQLGQYNWKIPEKFLSRMLPLTGGNPALVLYLSLYLSEYPTADLQNSTHLVEYPSLRARLNDMKDILVKYPYSLARKINMVSEGNQPFCDLLKYYLNAYESKSLDLWNDTLTQNEQKMLELLLNNRGRLVEKEKLSLILGKDSNSYSLWGNYKAIERLRKKLKGTYSFRTVKGKGIVLL